MRGSRWSRSGVQGTRYKLEVNVGRREQAAGKHASDDQFELETKRIQGKAGRVHAGTQHAACIHSIQIRTAA